MKNAAYDEYLEIIKKDMLVKDLPGVIARYPEQAIEVMRGLQARAEKAEAELAQKTQELELVKSERDEARSLLQGILVEFKGLEGKHRWHKWPEEKPTDGSISMPVFYLVKSMRHGQQRYDAFQWDGTGSIELSWTGYGVTHWREIVGPEEGK